MAPERYAGKSNREPAKEGKRGMGSQNLGAGPKQSLDRGPGEGGSKGEKMIEDHQQERGRSPLCLGPYFGKGGTE